MYLESKNRIVKGIVQKVGIMDKRPSPLNLGKQALRNWILIAELIHLNQEHVSAKPQSFSIWPNFAIQRYASFRFYTDTRYRCARGTGKAKYPSIMLEILQGVQTLRRGVMEKRRYLGIDVLVGRISKHIPIWQKQIFSSFRQAGGYKREGETWHCSLEMDERCL